MKDNWKSMKFSDAIEINNYPSASKGDEYIHIGMSDLEENYRKIESWERKDYTYSKPRFKNQDTVFARITPCLENGKIAYVDNLPKDEIATGSTEFFIFSATEHTIPKFVYYTARREDIRQKCEYAMEGTSNRQRVPKDIFDEIEINVPPINEQRKIVNILDAIDSKIELNREISELLEETARAIYESWFVEFEPYKEEYDFLSTELGPIPEHFQIKQLESICTKESGYGFKSDNYVSKESGKPIIRSKNISEKNIVEMDDLKYVDTTKEDKSIHKFDTLLTMVGKSTGKLGIYLNNKTVLLNQNLWRFRSDNPLFLHNLLTQINFSKFKEGSAREYLSWGAIKRINIPYPPNSEIKKYEKLVKPIYKKRSNLYIESEFLEETRNYLLPLLLSGDVSLSIE